MKFCEITRALSRLPRMEGGPIHIRFLPSLQSHRGRLLSGERKGTSVHAGTFIRKREIVLETELLDHPAELRRILAHEMFHFVWRRLGNPSRRSFESLIGAELRSGARGELGWSAELRKLALESRDQRERTRRWREYVCESFCDTAAWLYGSRRGHAEFMLAPRFRRLRQRWFRETGARRSFSI